MLVVMRGKISNSDKWTDLKEPLVMARSAASVILS